MSSLLKYGDEIESLPNTKTNITVDEINIMNTFFSNNDKLINDIKEMILLLVLYIIFSINAVDILIKKFIPITNNSIYILYTIKGLIFVISYFLIKNIKFAMK